MNEKIKELFTNQEFVEKMLALESAQEVQDLLAENDVDFTIEEINKLHEELVKKAQQAEEGEDADGEIDDEDLEDVAGGVGLMIAAVAGLLFESVGLPVLIKYGFRSSW